MGADINCLMGEIMENPEHSNTNTEELLVGLLTALLREQALSLKPTKIEVASESASSC